jgi:hypothetical protein
LWVSFLLVEVFSVFLFLFRKDLFRLICLPACPPVRGIFVRAKETKKKKKEQGTNKDGNEEGGKRWRAEKDKKQLFVKRVELFPSL